MTGIIDTSGKRELLYTMNDKPVYKDELRPIGESPFAWTSNLPWKELFYAVCLITGVVGSTCMEFGSR